ncbi:MAG: glycerophosphodiester phosphodiesterase family protein [Fimbriimonadaceae bacterium]
MRQRALLIGLLLLGLVSGAMAGFAPVLDAFKDEQREAVFVVAHRGKHDVYPENSLPSLFDAIDHGIPIAEIDVRRTLDGRYVLLHDAVLERETTGGGPVNEKTYAEVKQLRMRHRLAPTNFRVPSLEQAFLAAKDRLILNIDPKDVVYEEVIELARRHGVEDQLIFKESWRGLSTEEREFWRDSGLMFMPKCSSYEEALEAMQFHPWHALELSIGSPQDALWQKENLDQLQSLGARLWINTLWAGSGASGVGDAMVRDKPVQALDRLFGQGLTIIQTDYPSKLSDALHGRGLSPFDHRGG